MLRFLSEDLYLRELPILPEDPALEDVSLDDRRALAVLVASCRSAVGKEEVWAMPYLFGVVARFSLWGKTDQGKSSSCCRWISPDSSVRCTWVGSDVYNADVSLNRESSCGHTDVFAAAIEQMASALKRPVSIVQSWLQSSMAANTHAVPNEVDLIDEESPVWRIIKDIVVVVFLHRGVPVSVPVHLPKRGVSCGFCPLSGVRGCSHTNLPSSTASPTATCQSS